MLEAKERRSLAVAVAVIIGFVEPAVAQTPAVEVSGGYQAPYDNSIEKWFPAGWRLDVAANVNETWAVLADVGHASRSEGVLDVEVGLYTFGGGVRWSRRTVSRLVPFAQFLAGAALMRSRADVAGGTLTVSQTKWMVQPGGGVNFLIGKGWGIVGEADFRRILLDENEDGRSGLNQLELFTGIRFAF